MSDKYREICNEYYICKLHTRKRSDEICEGWLRIYRKDINESVYGRRIFVDTLDQAIDSLEAIANDFLRTSKRPEDWENVSPVKIVLLNYLKIKDRLDSYWGKRPDGKYEDNHFRLMSEMRDLTKKSTLELVTQVMELTETDKQKLVIGTQEEYDKCPEDGYILDILSARTQLFKYIINPSESVIRLHKKHWKRMNWVEE